VAIRERVEWRDRTRVFRDRAHAGAVLAEMLEGLRGTSARVLAIPAGGVPVGAALAEVLGLPLEAAVVSKVTLPWNTEVGYGAVAFDGSVLLNDELIAGVGLDAGAVRRGVETTREKVRRRVASLRGASEERFSGDETVILVDDGLASGFTMRAAVAALRASGVRHLHVAVPTASDRAVETLAGEVEELTCANVRTGPRFAVAEAYQAWRDVEESEARALLARQAPERPSRPG
jgi:putative phosphoribosyl transferase